MIIFLLIIPVFNQGGQYAWSSNFPLDAEAVFCVYYKMIGGNIADQDIEDLCFSSGRPTFSMYKPSEMFMKNTLKEKRGNIIKEMAGYNQGSLFIWRLKGFLFAANPDTGKYNISYKNNKLPQPTFFIRSELSERGKKKISKILNSLKHKIRAKGDDLRKSGSVKKGRGDFFEITVHLRPEKVVYRFEKRNIAREDVLLPFRYVIFDPIKIKLDGFVKSQHFDGFVKCSRSRLVNPEK